jgi:hypothetical protein
MTPEREAQIRGYSPHWAPGSAIKDLLAEIDRLRKIRINSQATYDLVLEKYDSLKAAAKHVTTVFHDERKGDLRLAIDSLSVALEEK